MTRLLALPLILTLLVPVAGCQDYLARRDTLTLGSGEAVQANVAKQVIDPWPAHASRIDPYTDGERLAHGIERYRNPTAGPGQAILPPIPVAAGNVPVAGAVPALR